MEYCVVLVKLLLGVIVRTLPLIEIVTGMYVPVARFLTLIERVPAFIDSLNVILITLLTATFTALFVGSVLFMVGAVPSVLKVVLPAYKYLFPDKSVTLPECTSNVYLVPLVKLLVGVIVNILLLMLVVNATAFPLLVFNSIQPVPFFIA